MNLRLALSLAALGCIAAAVSPPATAHGADRNAPLEVEIFDRRTGAVLPLHRHRGALYVAGEPGHEYEIRLRNREGGRVLAVTSVDGVNVLTGRTAATAQSGYVIDGWSSGNIDGWRKSMDEVASFYFTRLRNSYAARTGRPDHVGVIGVAMFRERPQPVPMFEQRYAPSADTAASESLSEPAPAPPAARADNAARQRSERDQSKLGTGHGQRRDSRVTETTFERASDTPDAIVRIYYDSYPRLVAQGIIPGPRVAQRRPEAFPEDGFVPDP